MKKLTKSIFLFLTLFFLNSSICLADSSYFIDFKKVLNKSKAGSAAQIVLKKNFESESSKFIKQENNLKKKESDIISQKKTITPEEYKKKVDELRKKVFELQKQKKNSFDNIGKKKNLAKKSLLEALNPIIKKYMEDNNIRLILDKKSVVMGDTNLEITNQIIAILNKEVPSLKIN